MDSAWTIVDQNAHVVKTTPDVPGYRPILTPLGATDAPRHSAQSAHIGSIPSNIPPYAMAPRYGTSFWCLVLDALEVAVADWSACRVVGVVLDGGVGVMVDPVTVEA
jgi:hypothetical protein